MTPQELHDRLLEYGIDLSVYQIRKAIDKAVDHPEIESADGKIFGWRGKTSPLDRYNTYEISEEEASRLVRLYEDFPRSRTTKKNLLDPTIVITRRDRFEATLK